MNQEGQITTERQGQQLTRATELAQVVSAQAPLGVRATLKSARLAITEGEDAAIGQFLPDLQAILQSEDSDTPNPLKGIGFSTTSTAWPVSHETLASQAVDLWTHPDNTSTNGQLPSLWPVSGRLLRSGSSDSPRFFIPAGDPHGTRP